MTGNIVMPSPLRLQGTASWAESASIAITASYALNAGGNLSGGTDRYIALWTGTSTLATSSLYQDTNGRVGIGTATPSGALDISTTQSLSWGATSTAGVIIGSKVTGSSLLVRLSPKNSGFDSGIALDGNYPDAAGAGTKTEARITALGTFAGSGYHSDLIFRVTHQTNIFEMMRLSRQSGNPTILMTGSLTLSGSSHTITGSLNGNFTGSLQGTSSWAVSASVAISASIAVSSSFAISSSQATSASFALSSSQATSASFAISSSQSISASFALSSSISVTSSYVSTLKAGSGSVASFGGSSLSASITFATAFANNNYAVTVTGEDVRSWTIQSKTAAGFIIDSNSTVALTGPVYWIATPFN